MIRRIVFLLFTVILFAVGCDRSGKEILRYETDPSLAAIDSLMWSQPDSAFARLQAFAESPESDRLDTFNGHYFHLLLSELLYKNDYAQTNREDLLETVAYYDSLVTSGGKQADENLVFLDARAHYIDGVGYYETDSVISACREYHRAVELIEERFGEEELTGKRAQFMALAYTHLNVVFSQQYLHEQAIYYAKCSLPYYHRHETEPWHLAWILDEIGLNYHMLNQLDSAYPYYQQAKYYQSDTVSTNYRDIKIHELMLRYRKGMSTAQDVISQLLVILESANDDREYYSRCLTIGAVYYYENQYDLARPYLTKVFKESTDVDSKKLAAYLLVKIGNAMGEESAVREYAYFLASFATQNESESAVKSELNQYHNAFCQQKQYRQYQSEEKARVTWWVLLVGVLVLIIVVYITLFHKNKRKKQRLENHISSERQAYEVQKKALAGRLKRSNKTVKELKERISELEKMDTVDHTEIEKADSFMDEPICQYILKVANDTRFSIKSTVPLSDYASIALTREQLLQLNEAVEKHYYVIHERLLKEYPELKGRDLTYCNLCLLGLNKPQIAALLQQDLSTVWKREKRLKRIFGKNKPVGTVLKQFFTT